MDHVEGYGPTSYGDGFADVYDDWYADVSAPAETAGFLADRVEGPVLELGSGTGRLTTPLRAAGIDVIGLDASESMLRRSRRRDSGVPVVVADMAHQPIRPHAFGGVLIAFNTLFNLPSAELQAEALRQAAAALAPGGIVVVEAFVPTEPSETEVGTADRVDVVRLEVDVVVLRVSRTDRATGTVSGQHVELRDGAPVRLRPWHLRFTDPDGLDELATRAGLELVERLSDWSGRAFDDRSTTHVSVYRAFRSRR